MSQSTDTTAVLPLADSPQAQLDPDATHEMPIVKPVAPVAPAVPIVPPQPAFDAQRVHEIHTLTVLGRILRTAALPLPVMWEGHQFSRPSLSLYLDSDLTSAGVKAYQGVFGGELATEQRDSAVVEGLRAQLDTLTTVIDGLDVTVSCWSDLPQAPAAEPEPEPVVEAPVETPEAA